VTGAGECADERLVISASVVLSWINALDRMMIRFARDNQAETKGCHSLDFMSSLMLSLCVNLWQSGARRLAVRRAVLGRRMGALL